MVSKVTIKVEGLREIENAARADQPARAETVRGDGGLVRKFPLSDREPEGDKRPL